MTLSEQDKIEENMRKLRKFIGLRFILMQAKLDVLALVSKYSEDHSSTKDLNWLQTGLTCVRRMPDDRIEDLQLKKYITDLFDEGLSEV
jgi:hypothetical protein